MAPTLQHLFAYGTLQLAEVLEAVTGLRLPSEAATLNGFERFRVRGKPYPGLVPSAAAITTGVLWRDVPVPTWESLDRFEGSLYERRSVAVTLATGANAPAEAYVIPDSRRDELTDDPWRLEDLSAEVLARFLRTSRAFGRDPAAHPGAEAVPPADRCPED